jgi:hypothetical protein
MGPDGKDRFLLEMKNGYCNTFIRTIFSRNATGDVDGSNLRYSRLMYDRFNIVD